MNRPRPSGAAAGGGQTVKAVIVVAVVVLVGYFILKDGTKTPTTAAGSTATTVHHGHSTTTAVAAPTTTQALISPANIKLQVLNGVGTGLLAGQWSAKLHANPGYDTLVPLDATAVGLPTSAIYVITPGYTREADALATQVGLTAAIVNPTIPPPATAPIPARVRNTANLVLVIGRDLAATA